MIRSKMTEITWTNCTEKMPPNTMKFELIYRANNEVKSGFGATFNVIADIHPRWESVKHLFEWTDYSPEKWEWLTRNNNKTRLSINSYDPSSPNGYD